ncbi:MAG: hypothetical protein JNL75_08815 [Chitinophagales bacterium]|nr:hypothetical protein [Chitinophagales bacterium]
MIFLCWANSYWSQIKLSIYDSSLQIPLVGASVLISPQNNICYSQLDGTAILPSNLLATDSIVISSLGYERKVFLAVHLPTKVLLSPKKYILPSTTIRPIAPRDYIQRAFDSFHANHLSKSFSQSVFYREEFIVNDQYARFQEMDLEVYQFPKKDDSRPYYISGSFPKVKQFYKKDDTILMNDIKYSLGKIVGKKLNFNYLTGYSYIKGVNMLNFIFTQLLESKDIQYKLLGIENIKGHNALHIQGKYFKDNINYTNIDVYLEENSYAVLHVAITANDENLTKQFLDFKTRTLLWLVGIKIDVKKYYSKLQFTKSREGLWVVEDFLLMLPVTIRKKKTLDMYVNIGYRMNPLLNMSAKPLGYSVYQENQHLFDSQKIHKRFSEKLGYSIPLLPAQIDRLDRMR